MSLNDTEASVGPIARKSAPQLLTPGQAVGPYCIEGVLGTGASSAVYQARRDQRTFALKLLHRRFQNSQLRRRFDREIQILRDLAHPSVPQIHDAGEFHGAPYYVMDIVTGAPLSKLVRDHAPLTGDTLIKALKPIAEALDRVHANGIIHRDVKPSNMVIQEDGAAILIDFGVARLESPDAVRLTADQQTCGTPVAMAPEQFRSGAVTSAADVYALGVVAYYALSGRYPFESSQHSQLAWLHMNEHVPRLSVHAPVPATVDDVIRVAMSKVPEDRFTTCSEFVEALDHALLEVETAPFSQASLSSEARLECSVSIEARFQADEDVQDLFDELVEEILELGLTSAFDGSTEVQLEARGSLVELTELRSGLSQRLRNLPDGIVASIQIDNGETRTVDEITVETEPEANALACVRGRAM